VLSPRGRGLAALLAVAVLVVLVITHSGGTGSSTGAGQHAPLRASKQDHRRGSSSDRRHSAAPTDGSGKVTPGDLIVSGIDGLQASSDLLARARRGEIAGVILMGANVDTLPQVQALTRSVQTAAREGGQLPLLVMVDQEGGTVKRFLSAGPSQSARGLAALPLGRVEQEGLDTGRDLLARGANVDLAPVVDVGAIAGNFLGTRTFGGEVGAVSRNACRFAAGLRRSGVGVTLKHFPGLGSAGTTSTDVAPVAIDEPFGRLQEDWEPYRRCGRLGQTLTMVSNATYPTLTGSVPALLSSHTYTALRRELGFTGPVITDALGAGALQGQRDVPLRAVDAGADLLLYTGEQESKTGYKALLAAAAAGYLPTATLNDRAVRVRALRRALSAVSETQGKQ
jgi:beta-N-acetylhexosaminidase